MHPITMPPTREWLDAARARIQRVLQRPESPAEHVRNALAILGGVRTLTPALFMRVPELHFVTRRCELAVLVLEAPAASSAEKQQAVELAIQATIAVPLDWRAVEELPAITHRLFQALNALWDGGAICLRCGGTILPPTIGGVPRGTCHCPRCPRERITDWSAAPLTIHHPE